MDSGSGILGVGTEGGGLDVIAWAVEGKVSGREGLWWHRGQI